MWAGHSSLCEFITVAVPIPDKVSSCAVDELNNECWLASSLVYSLFDDLEFTYSLDVILRESFYDLLFVIEPDILDSVITQYSFQMFFHQDKLVSRTIGQTLL